VQGNAEQFVLLTVWMVRFDGVSLTTMLFASDGPLFVTVSV
jgi:hypothetical protein